MAIYEAPLPTAASVRPTGEFEIQSRTEWPTTFFVRKYRDHAADAAGIIEYLYQLRSREKDNIASGVAPAMKSQHGLFESKLDLFERNEHAGLTRLVAFIESTLRRAVWHINGRNVDPKRIAVKFKDSWFHITNGGGFHDAHTHGGCSWCGIYYLQISNVASQQPTHAPNGVNRFYGPIGTGGGYDDFGNYYLKHNVLDVPPVEGNLVLFPAYLLHSGLAYKGEKDRVILSFNSVSWLDNEGVRSGPGHQSAAPQ